MMNATLGRIAMLIGLLWWGCAAAFAAANTAALLDAALAGNQRPAAEKARDVWRHPKETLLFFGLQPDMTVIELSPGGGWYTAVLAPVLRDHGQLIEAVPPADSPSAFMRRMAQTLATRMKADPVVYDRVKTVAFAPPARVDLGPDNSADMVLTFRNTHDWLNSGSLDKVFAAAYKVLKPGGVFGVTDHRARSNTDAKQSAKQLHRIPEDYLIELGLKTGFRLAGVSEINANPKDDHVVNVHHLPPDLRGPASEHAKMEAIGESDRMTLRFVKP